MLLHLDQGKTEGAVRASDRRVGGVGVKDVADSTEVRAGRSGRMRSLGIVRRVTLDLWSRTQLGKLRGWTGHGMSRHQHGSTAFTLLSGLLELLSVKLQVVLMRTHLVGGRDVGVGRVAERHLGAHGRGRHVLV